MNETFKYFLKTIPLGRAHPCSYLSGLTQQNQEFLLEEISDNYFEFMLSQGFRHFGSFFFRYACNSCGRCLPIRIPIKEFKFSKSQRRILKKVEEKITYTIHSPSFSREKAEMYRQHSREQFDQRGGDNFDFQINFIYSALKQTKEFIYYYQDIPIGHGFVDILPSCLSSIYFFYNPDFKEFSLGTYSILCEIKYALEHKKDFLYLGYYIYENKSMRYKADFRPCEVFTPFETWSRLRDKQGNYLLSPETARCHIPKPPEPEDPFDSLESDFFG